MVAKLELHAIFSRDAGPNPLFGNRVASHTPLLGSSLLFHTSFKYKQHHISHRSLNRNGRRKHN
jgi:hypothetical protein